MMCKSLRDLSKRAAEKKRQVIVKLLIDHLTKENITHCHAILPSDKWTDFNIPSAEELTFVQLEVNCYHRLIMGAFHLKFLVVD
ncbi:unnamed protein product [Adineta ricciae]|uniref:Uncharacterized protein n=1 Tax=Adineta ricciae TaxID=249248 RepID=A0A815ZJR7_ADIRI|nr:unnamed protein product [Adineta ricciae]